MDFFRHQSEAQTRSRQLICLFVLAVGLVMLGINLLGAAIWYVSTQGSALPDYFIATNSFIVLLYVGGSAWLESQSLDDSGSSVAYQLGARSPSPYDIRHKRLTNITDEVAIAAGIPVPEVFILDHESINALAAGRDPAHASIVITDGALQTLTRDELQGVIAHEVSHIVNGDAAINTRLAGGLYGLYSLNLLGRRMLAGAFASAVVRNPVGRNSSFSGLIPFPLLFLLGAVLVVVGWFGKVCGHMVQAGVSRQREYLADASAVRFTRSRDGIGGALRKIAGQESDGTIDSGYSDVVSHLWLSSDRPKGRWFDSHPPLIDRVRRIYGRPLPAVRPTMVEVVDDSEHESIPALQPLPFQFSGGGAMLASVAAVAASTSVRRASGTSRGPDIPRHCANQAMASMSDESVTNSSMVAMPPAGDENDSDGFASHHADAAVLLAAVRDPGTTLSSAALILNAIVAGPGASAVDETASDPELHVALMWLEQADGQWLRVPLIELLSARLRNWPLESRRTLVRYCHDAVLADGRIEKTEWVYFTLVRHRLLPAQRSDTGAVSATDQRKALGELFTMAGQLSEQSARKIRDAIVSAAAELGVPQPASTPDQLRFRSMTRALDVLSTMAPLRKPALLRALASLEREAADPVYRAFMVAVAAAIDCPPLQLDSSDSPFESIQNGAGQFSESQIA